MYIVVLLFPKGIKEIGFDGLLHNYKMALEKSFRIVSYIPFLLYINMKL